MITDKQRKSIFYFCGILGINTENRRTMQESVTGKSSLSDFTYNDAEELLGVLARQLKGYNLEKSIRPGKRRNCLHHAENVINLPTRDQLKKIIAMSIQLYGKYSDEDMDAFCRRRLKKPFRLITAKDAIRIIEIQKYMLRRKYPELGKEDSNDKSNKDQRPN